MKIGGTLNLRNEMSESNTPTPADSKLPQAIQVGDARLDLHKRIAENREAEERGEVLLVDEEIDEWLARLEREDWARWQALHTEHQKSPKSKSRGIG